MRREEYLDTIIEGECLERLTQLPNNCIQSCVTSTPYFCLRDYRVVGQYGMENTPEEFIEKLVQVSIEVRRVLMKDGTLWINIGDSYWGSGKAGNNKEYQKRHSQFGKVVESGSFGRPTSGKHPFIKPKDLIGIPRMLAFALRNSGWWWRQEIIWHKPNCMPESVEDRCTRMHEHIFMFAKSQKYYYDAEAVKTEVKYSTLVRWQNTIGSSKYNQAASPIKIQGINRIRLKKQDGHGPRHKGFNGRYRKMLEETGLPGKVNLRSVWKISTKALKEKHFAAFPYDIPQICIRASTKVGDVVLDPFMGSGTTALVAACLDRNYVGFELNPQYVAIANRRLRSKLGLFFKG